MNILITVGIFPPDIGGPASFVPKITNSLIKNGHNVKIICLSDKQNLSIEDKFNVTRITRSTNLPFRWLITIFKIIQYGLKNDVIFVNGLGVESAIANIFIRKKIVRKIVGDPVWERSYNKYETDQTFDEFQNSNNKFSIKIQRLIRDWSINRSEIIITPSDHLNSFVSQIKLDNKIETINNGIEIAPKRIVKDRKKENHLIMISRLVVQKNINLVIEALELLHDKNIKLTVIGDGEEFGNLEKQINALKLKDNVKLIGKVHNSKIFEYLLKADLFIQASDYEGLPHSVLEAINYEVPILSTEVGGCRDLLEDGENGFIIHSPPNKEQIAKQIDFIISNETQAKKKAKNAKKLITDKYNFLKQAQIYEEILYEVTNKQQ